MSQQLLSRAGSRRILTGAKDHIPADGVRQCVERARRFGRLGVGMHAHIGEIMSEAGGEEFARRCIERLATLTN